MSRPPKYVTALGGLPPLRKYWRDINRQERNAQALVRARYKAHDQRRPKCRCNAYPWPHRPGGGLCRYPDPPIECYQRKAGCRPYRERYTGLRRQIARANGLHPIRDRAALDNLMPQTMNLAKELKRRCPRVKYRNITITDRGVSGSYQTYGPAM